MQNEVGSVLYYPPTRESLCSRYEAVHEILPYYDDRDIYIARIALVLRE